MGRLDSQTIPEDLNESLKDSMRSKSKITFMSPKSDKSPDLVINTELMPLKNSRSNTQKVINRPISNYTGGEQDPSEARRNSSFQTYQQQSLKYPKLKKKRQNQN